MASMKSGVSHAPSGIVLLGAGHAHVQVLRAFGMRPLPGVSVSIIVDRLLAPYSGMLPGCIAGDYSRDDIHIDVASLASAAGVRLVHGAATGIDRTSRQVLISGQAPVAYDWLSINVGITPDLSMIEGADRFAVPVKPIAGILDRLERAEERVKSLERPARLAVIGGGAAGIELALALRDRNQRLARSPLVITLVAGRGLAPGLNKGMRRRAMRALARADIAVVEERAIAITQGEVLLASGVRLDIDLAFASTSARLPGWLTATDLPKAVNGGIAVRQTLQVMDDDCVFAAGDCATMVADPRPRAGVFAVRQGPYLARNLEAAACGETLVHYRPQKDYLTILRTGGNTAIAGRGQYLSVEGVWVSRWKDWIDRRFMHLFDVVERSSP